MTTRHIVSGDVTLAAWEQGPPDAPTVLLVHGFPDTHAVWDGVAVRLAAKYHVVTYDVRGAGVSSAPPGDSAYRLELLSDDLVAVARAFSPERPVHVVGHDWGSIQAWEPIADPRHAGRFASFTSISGPCLDHIGHWMRTAPRLTRARQALASWYIGAFHIPGAAAALPALAPRLERLVGLPMDDAAPTLPADLAQGTSLYRANMRPRIRRPGIRRVHVPVQVVVPTRDRYVTAPLAECARPWVDMLSVRPIDGEHWVVKTSPELVAELIAQQVEQVESSSPSKGAGEHVATAG